jgi:hypothetical protein
MEQIIRYVVYLSTACVALFPREAYAVRDGNDAGYLGLGYPTTWVRYEFDVRENGWEFSPLSIPGVMMLLSLVLAIWSFKRKRQTLGTSSRRSWPKLLLRSCGFGLVVTHVVGIPFAAVLSYEKSYAVVGPASRYVWAYFYTIFFLVEWELVMPSAVLLGTVLFLLRLALSRPS